MRLEEGLGQRSIALDVTPLIDVVFILVIFFAVTTSFINPQDLARLQGRLSSLVIEQGRLEQTLADEYRQTTRLNAELNGLQSALAALQTRYDQALKELATAGARVQSLDSELAAARAQSAQAQQAQQQRLDTLQAQLADTEQTARRRQNELAELRQLQQTTAASWQAAEQAATQLRQELAQASLALQKERASQRVALADLSTELRTTQLAAERFEREAALAKERLVHSRANAEGLEQQSAALRADNERYQKLLAGNQLRLTRLDAAEQGLAERLQNVVQNESLRIERRGGELILNLADQVLFDSGSAELRTEGLAVLRQVGKLLQSEFADFDLQVGGHTDNVPVRGRFTSNWALSAARAVNVAEFLERAIGISGARLTAVGYGEYRPLAANDTPENRARNRRIELVLLPRPER